ncbi:MAG: universal stress protein [Bacillota bacterium]|nr:universal stress protein [Bacillota bacterium]MDP4160982.1 universal stress protein [Bacillota bacterium]
MFKRVLVPTDASEYSRRALKNALEIARQIHAEVELLYVMAPPEAYWGPYVARSFEISTQEIEQGGERVLENTLEGLDIGGVSLKTKKLQGHPATLIIEEVKKENIDLIVMGSRGYGPIAGSILGSVSQRVLQRAGCCVLIVK